MQVHLPQDYRTWVYLDRDGRGQSKARRSGHLRLGLRQSGGLCGDRRPDRPDKTVMVLEVRKGGRFDQQERRSRQALSASASSEGCRPLHAWLAFFRPATDLPQPWRRLAMQRLATRAHGEDTTFSVLPDTDPTAVRKTMAQLSGGRGGSRDRSGIILPTKKTYFNDVISHTS